MDQQKLRTLVFEKTGVKIDVDDPVFALVALNEAVLEEAVERHVALLREANAALAGQVAGLQGRASGPALPPSAAPSADAPAPAARSATIAAGTAVLGAVLVLGGQALLFQPAPAPAPVVLQKQLSAGQAAALRNADKLSRIVDKLDEKTRAAIAAEMQKP